MGAFLPFPPLTARHAGSSFREMADIHSAHCGAGASEISVTIVFRDGKTSLDKAECKKCGTILRPGEPQQASSGSGCFSATAAYGSEAPEVVQLRRFRGERLRHTLLGRWLSACYARVSPSLARLIAGSRLCRRCARALLVRPALRIAWFDAGR